MGKQTTETDITSIPEDRPDDNEDPISNEVGEMFSNLTDSNGYKANCGLSLNTLSERTNPLVSDETIRFPESRGKAMFI